MMLALFLLFFQLFGGLEQQGPRPWVTPPPGAFLGANSGADGGNIASLEQAAFGGSRVFALHMYYFYVKTNGFSGSFTNDIAVGRTPFFRFGCDDGLGDNMADETAHPPQVLLNDFASIAAIGRANSNFHAFISPTHEINENYGKQCAGAGGCGGANDNDCFRSTTVAGSEAENIAWWHMLYRTAAMEGALPYLTWVWCPEFGSVATINPGIGDDAHVLNDYPGDGVVDWVGWDAYDKLNEGIAAVQHGYDYFHDRFPSKPLIVPETGEYNPNACPGRTTQAAFLASLLTAIKPGGSMYPGLKALMYFNSDPGQNCGSKAGNWVLVGSGLTEMGVLGADPYFGYYPGQPAPGPAHVLTTIYGCGPTDPTICTQHPNPADFAQYVTWAYPDESNAWPGPPVVLYRNAGIKAFVYSNSNRCYATDNPLICYSDLKPGGVYAAAEAQDCSGHVLTDTSHGGGYQNDPRNTPSSVGLVSATSNFRLGEFVISGTAQYDALFADDTDTVYGLQYGGVTEYPCNWNSPDPTTWVNATISMFNSLTGTYAPSVPIEVNALAPGLLPNATPAQVASIVTANNVFAAQCEGCVLNSSAPYIETGTTWQSVENTEIQVVDLAKIYHLYTTNTEPSIAQRIYAYASFLLGYDKNYSMFQNACDSTACPSGFPLGPEVQLVPENPTSTVTGDVSGYGLNGGYFRQWNDCFYDTIDKGVCAVFINSGTSTITVPSGWTKQMTLSGSDLLDGGTASFTTAAPSTLAAGSAVILFP